MFKDPFDVILMEPILAQYNLDGIKSQLVTAIQTVGAARHGGLRVPCHSDRDSSADRALRQCSRFDKEAAPSSGGDTLPRASMDSTG